MFIKRIPLSTFLMIALSFVLDISTGEAVPLIWYDLEKQAIGINPWADGWGGPDIFIDFNTDHSSAGVIMQHVWSIEEGHRTTVSVYKYHGGGSTSWFYDPISSSFDENYVYLETSLFVTEAADYGGDMLRYFVDEWNVAEAKTTIYVQPTNANHATIPVVEGDLQNISYALGDIFAPLDPTDWRPIPEPATLFLLGLGGLPLIRKRAP